MPERGFGFPFIPGGGRDFERRWYDTAGNPITLPTTWPPKNPQIDVVELPPTNTPDPAPLPNPTGEYPEPFVPPTPQPPTPQPRPREPVSTVPPGAYPAGPATLDPDDFEGQAFEGAMRYGIEGYDFEEFVGDFGLDPIDEAPRFRPLYDVFSTHIVAPTPQPMGPFPAPPGGAGAPPSAPRGLSDFDEILRRTVGEPDFRKLFEEAGRKLAEKAASRAAQRALGALGAKALGGIVGILVPSFDLAPEPDIVYPRPMPAPAIPEPVITQPEVPWNTPSPSPLPVPSPSPMPSPAPSPSPAPAPAPAPSSPPRPRPQTRTGTVTAPSLPGWLMPLLSATLARSSPLARASTFTAPAPAPAPLPLAPAPAPAPPSPLPVPQPPTPVPVPTPLTPFQPQVLTSPRRAEPPRDRRCRCRKTKRGKRRECRERADVVWAGGPRKGKKAGSRCVKFAR